MDFIREYDPRRGDLLYGIKMPRAIVQGKWQQHWQSVVKGKTASAQEKAEAQEKIDAGSLYICDRYNNHFELAEPQTYRTPNTLAGKFANLSQQTTTAGNKQLSADQQARIQAYASGIQASRFSPAAAMNAPSAKLALEGAEKAHFNKKRKWWEALTDQKRDLSRERAALSANVTQLAIRRACKFGIGMVGEDPQFKDAKIHFILDGLDMAKIATKDTIDGGWLLDKGRKDYVSITTSELRYVYRNWGKLSSKVNLYVKGNLVEAPWVSDWKNLDTFDNQTPKINAEKALWDAYGQQRLAKYAGNIPDKSLRG